MNLHEIETALKTLSSHHSNLTEETLLVLLRAGGWEEKTIREALLLFRTLDLKTSPVIPVVSPQENSTASLPHFEEKTVLPALVNEDHRIEERVQEKSRSITSHEVEAIKKVAQSAPEVHSEIKSSIGELVSLQENPVKEKTFSLIEREEPVLIPREKESAPVVITSEKTSVVYPGTELLQEKRTEKRLQKKTEFPENLPLKLYEHSQHAVPFSQYRESIYGTIEGEQKEGVYEKEDGHTTLVPEMEVDVTHAKVSAFEAETKLIILASAMLLIIMLLLGYMYTNGRL